MFSECGPGMQTGIDVFGNINEGRASYFLLWPNEYHWKKNEKPLTDNTDTCYPSADSAFLQVKLIHKPFENHFLWHFHVQTEL